MDKKNLVIYQIWPRSFYDSNQDGIGDLPGIIQKLDYLQELGIQMIWLSPVYQSPNHDYGYDISDYYQIHPDFGTMEQFDELLSECKHRNIGVIMDLVANHTSDQHPWFQAALRDRGSKYRDYYYFRPGVMQDNKLTPPNNWMSFFGGSSWQYDFSSNEYYLTQFTPHQCDLNWNNKEVREEIYNIMRFYLDKGVAGFRLDVINTIDKLAVLPSKDPHKKGLQFPADYTIDRPQVPIWLQEMQHEVVQNYDCLLIGECVLVTKDSAALYTNPETPMLDMVFQFDLMLLGCGALGKFDFRKGYRFSIKDMKQVIRSWQMEMIQKNGYLGNYLSNHDNPRPVSRFGNTKLYHKESAKCLAVLNFTLYGTPFLYQGEEIGMTNHSFKQADWKDYEAKSVFEVLQTKMHLPKFLARFVINKMTRDHARTPMQWNNRIHAGFSTAPPWIVVNPNYAKINVEDDLASSDSIIACYKSLIALRKEHIALREGDFEELLGYHSKVLCFIRNHEAQRIMVILNLSHRSTSIEFAKPYAGTFLYSNYPGSKKLTQFMVLVPYEAILYQL